MGPRPRRPRARPRAIDETHRAKHREAGQPSTLDRAQRGRSGRDDVLEDDDRCAAGKLRALDPLAGSVTLGLLAHDEGLARATEAWTRTKSLAGQYQEVLELAATFKSPDWRAAHAAREAEYRMLTGPARDQVFAQAKAEMASHCEESSSW